MEKEQLAGGFGLLLAMGLIGVLLADGPREALQRVVVVNGLVLMFLCSSLVVRETHRAVALFGAVPPVQRPTSSTFMLVAACCTAGWLSTSLLLSGVPWQTWLAAYVGLLVFGSGTLYLRWRFQSMVPMLLSGIAFVIFAHVI